RELLPVQRYDEAEPDAHLRRGDCHHGEREDLARAVVEVPRERDQREVARVEHQLEREQHDERVAPDEDAERADPEQERRDGDVPGDTGAEHQLGTSSPCWRRTCVPRITPPTAATSRTIDVISKASRWSTRKTRPIQAGEPKAAPTSPGGAEARADLARVGEPAASLQADRDHDLDEQSGSRAHRGDGLPPWAAGPRGLVPRADVSNHEEEHHDYRTRVDEHLRGRDELGREQGTCAARTTSAESSRYRTASEARFPISASADMNGFENEMTATPAARHEKPATTQTIQTSTFPAEVATTSAFTNRSCRRGSGCRTCPDPRRATPSSAASGACLSCRS